MNSYGCAIYLSPPFFFSLLHVYSSSESDRVRVRWLDFSTRSAVSMKIRPEVEYFLSRAGKMGNKFVTRATAV